MTTTKRQTAGNNAALRSIKRQMNHLIYRDALTLMNEQGPAAVAEYLGQFFNDAARERAVARLMASEIN